MLQIRRAETSLENCGIMLLKATLPSLIIKIQKMLAIVGVESGKDRKGAINMQEVDRKSSRL